MTVAEFIARARWRLVRLVIPRTSQVRTVGSGVRVAQSTHISGGKYVRIDANANIGGQCSILVPDFKTRLAADEPVILIGSGTTIGEFCTISAVNHIHIQRNVLFGPRVWITDHNHVYSDISQPILAQGWTQGGAVDIEDGCWIGTGAVIIGNKALRIGRGSVVGANAVVTSDVPPHCVVGGNPARILKRYDPATATWQRVDK
jgi:acetyltransferase-like isoleucine patch superfamily enzyme